MPRCIPVLVCGAFIALALSACSFGESTGNRGNAPAPGSSTITRPSSISAAPTPMDTFRALAKPQGLRFTPLFSEPISDSDARIKRLENAVQSLRNDFDTIVPSLVRLVAIEKDMREMVQQMQTLTGAPATSTELPVEQVEIPSEDVVRGTEPVRSETGERTAPTSLVTPEAAPEGMPPEGAASPSSAARSSEIETIEVQKAVTAPAPVTPKAKAPPAVTEPAPQPQPQPAPPKKVITAPPPKPAPAAVPAEEAVASPPAPAEVPTQAATPQKAAVQTAATTAKPAEVVQWNHVFGNTQPTVADTPRPAATVGSVVEVRIGDHADKTRIVLDATTTENITATMDNDGKRLIIDLPQLGWTGKPSWSAEVAALVSGWTYKDGKLYVDLLYPATIKAQQALEGNASSMARVVIDLFSPEVHQQ